jgi:hypothetical protein
MSAPEYDDFDFWRLCDELTIHEAALLVAGESPAAHYHDENWDVAKRPRGYEAAKSAITNALRRNSIPGTIIEDFEHDINGQRYPLKGTITLESRVEVEGLRTWLWSRGLRNGFFFPQQVEPADYLNPSHPRYAPKLAAAVRAWQAVTDPAGKHPKQALMKWLRENAADFGLTDEDGKPNETGIEEAAKVANWQPGGGAPKTPTNPPPN